MTAKNKSKRVPPFRHHKASGQGFVELGGRRFYLGRYGFSEPRRRYHQIITEWLASGRQLPVAPEEITVVELIARSWQHACGYYVKPTGEATSEVNSIRQALRPLKELYGHTRATSFGPLDLRAVRQKMMDRGWCRTSVNKAVARIKRVFRWAAEYELVRGSVYHDLQAVSGLRRGRSPARESLPVRPVPQEHIDAIRPFVSDQLWALVRLQLLTAARSVFLFVTQELIVELGEPKQADLCDFVRAVKEGPPWITQRGLC